jgi:hypothetical protein
VVSWARNALPLELKERIPPAGVAAAEMIVSDDRYAGVALLFTMLMATWLLHRTMGLVPIFIIVAVSALFYSIPALMRKKGMRVKGPAKFEAALAKIDDVVCVKLPPKLRCTLR